MTPISPPLEAQVSEEELEILDDYKKKCFLDTARQLAVHMNTESLVQTQTRLNLMMESGDGHAIPF